MVGAAGFSPDLSARAEEAPAARVERVSDFLPTSTCRPGVAGGEPRPCPCPLLPALSSGAIATPLPDDQPAASPG